MLRLEAWERRIMEEILRQRSWGGGVHYPARLAHLFGRGTYAKLEKMKQQGLIEWSVQGGYTVTQLGNQALNVGKILEPA
jgi:hypothetical protein